jgi:hypothetical protein
MQIPQGWSASLFSTDIRGFAAIDKKAWGQLSMMYSFNGTGRWYSLDQMQGPRNQDYTISQAIPFEAVNWSGCGGTQTLAITSNVHVDDGDNGKAAATLTVDSIDGVLRQLYGVQWRRCNTGVPEMVQLHRFMNGSGQSKNDWGRLITSNPNESQIYPKFRYEVPAFKVYREKTDAEMVPLFRCFLNMYGGGFVSTDPNCEDNTIIGQYGYVYPTARPGHVALHRFFGPISHFHRLTTTNPAEGFAAKYNYQGIIGYAPENSSSVPGPTPTPTPTFMPGPQLGYLDVVGRLDIYGLIYWGPSQLRIAEAGGVIGQMALNASGAPMPADQRVRVQLEGLVQNKKLNRGTFAILQQPDPSNGNVMILRVDDPQKASGDYRFRLSWRPVF